jgi:GAF domain-containing protein
MTEAQTIAALADRLARRERELRAVHEISAAMHARAELDDLVRRTLLTAVETLEATAGSILLHEPEPRELVFRFVHGPSAGIARMLHGRAIPDTEGIAGHVFQSGQSLLTPDASRDPRHSERIDLATHFETRDMLTAALITTEARCIGVMQVLNRRRGAFEGADLKTLEILCQQAAAGIEAARLHETLLNAERDKRRFACEILRCVTGDKLRLVEATDIPRDGERAAGVELNEPGAYSRLRAEIERAGAAAGMAPDCASDLILAASEAATNTMKHARAGHAEVWVTPESLRVLVTDRGRGIQPKDLPRVLFQAGFSTKISLGMGYTLMMELADRVWLATGPDGTQIELEKCLRRPPPPEDPLVEVMERFANA